MYANLGVQGASQDMYIQINGNNTTVYIAMNNEWIKQTDTVEQSYDFFDLLKILVKLIFIALLANRLSL